MDKKEMKSEIKRLCEELSCNAPAGLDNLIDRELEILLSDLILKKMHLKLLQRRRLEKQNENSNRNFIKM